MRHYDYEKRRKVVTPVCFIVISLIIIDALLCQMLARAFAVMAWIKPPISLSSLPEIFCFVYVMAKSKIVMFLVMRPSLIMLIYANLVKIT